MYTNYCKQSDLKCELLEVAPGAPGLRAATMKISGGRAGRLAGEGGAHRIQHKTRSRKQDRIHTSTATVAVLPVPEKTDQGLLPMNEVRIEPFRASGPGGQHRNKSETAIRATHLETGLQATIDGRSQDANKRMALELLSARVTEQICDQKRGERQDIRSVQTMAERARSVRTYDLIRDVIRCDDGKKVKHVRKVLAGDLAPLLD